MRTTGPVVLKLSNSALQIMLAGICKQQDNNWKAYFIVKEQIKTFMREKLDEALMQANVSMLLLVNFLGYLRGCFILTLRENHVMQRMIFTFS